METINLEGHRLFKISHGYFVKSNAINDDSIASVLEKKGWICLNTYTGKGQGNTFINKVAIGDYVYVCYGGDELFCIGKVISDSKPLDEETDKLVHEDGEWVYREIEIIKSPINKSVREFKQDRRFHMPSGNSTFYEVSKYVLEQINNDVFQPKFGIKFINTMPTSIPTLSSGEKKGHATSSGVNHPLNQILYGPPGTGKTYQSISHAVAIIEGEDVPVIIQECEDGNRSSVRERFDDYVKSGQITFCTFHQSMSYEDFIEGIKPQKPVASDTFLKYDIEDGLFKAISKVAENNWFEAKATNIGKLPFETAFDLLKDDWYSNKAMKFSMKTEGKEFTVTGFSKKSISFRKASGGEGHTLSINTLKEIYYGGRENSKEGVGVYYPGILEKLNAFENKTEDIHENRYVLIIDEINRGNVSQIFGELITLIEDDKRLGKDEALKITLPYSGDDFGVPPNLFIIGTMNTADRSVEALDTALRRRFTFVPMLPEETKLKQTSDGIDLPKMLKTLNNRLKILKDADHTIGHAWLMNVTDTNSLSKAFTNKILPLLQEYFYNDSEKLGMLLGERFFKKPTTVDDKTLAKFFGSSLSSQYENAEQYQLEDVDKLTKEVFVSIYQ